MSKARSPVRYIVIGYAVAAVFWIVLSDSLLHYVWPAAESIYAIGLLKGIGFIVASTAVLLVLLRRSAHSVATSELRAHTTSALAEQSMAERDRADFAMRESERRWHAIFENEPECVKLVDRDGRLLAMNAAGLAMLEANSLEEAQRRPLLDFIAPEYRAKFGALHKRVIAGGTGKLEFEIVGLRGTQRWLETHAAPMRGAAGEVTMLLGITRDVSEQKRIRTSLEDAEARMRAMADNSPSGITLKSLDGRYLFVNARFADWHGIDRAAVIGGKADDVFPARNLESMREQERELLANGAPSWRSERITFHDGTEHDIEIVKFLVPGRELAIGSMAIDVTRQRAVEAQLRKAQRLEAVGQLTGGVAHDFNNLLTVVMGSLEALAVGVASDPNLSRAAELGLRATERGAELTRRLLAFSRRQALSPQAVDVNALIGEMTELLGRTLGETVRIETALRADTRAAFVDAGQLENALLNLAVNARDAMPEGGTLTISAENIRADAGDPACVEAELVPGEYVLLTVSDTGVGMPAHVAARVFEPFFTTKEAGKGSGLGLSMVYGFVRQSGGHIKLDTVPGQGTAVKMMLPAAAAPAATEDRRQPAKTELGAGQSILLVEDDSAVRDMLTDKLGQLGYRVQHAADGNEALAKLGSAQDFALLLSDVVLPGGISGLDIAEAVRRARPHVKVLLMSGYANIPEAEERLKALGATLLAKPFASATLSRAVSAALGASR